MADYISMKQVPNGTVTATDDRILYDYAINSGIIYGCEISYLGNNMIHINAGYGIIKGGLFEMEDHTEYVDYAEVTSTVGQIYLHFDAAASDKLTIVKETNATPHQMVQNEDANYENGVYEIQLCTFIATTTALAQVKQTFVQATMPIDVLDTLEAIDANTSPNKAAGALAVKALKKSVSDGKTLVANAITSKGVATATDATFQTMATNIGNIVTDIKHSVRIRRYETGRSGGGGAPVVINYQESVYIDGVATSLSSFSTSNNDIGTYDRTFTV